MVKVRCQECGEISDVKKNELDETSCDCGGDLAIQGSEDDTYEPEKCPICKKDIKSDEDTYTCDECSEEGLCEKCIHEFENCGSTICMDCLKGLVKTETKIEYQEKIVEKPVKVFVNQDGVPIDTSFNPSNKSKFD